MTGNLSEAVGAMRQQDRDEALAARIADILGWSHDTYEARLDSRNYIRVEDGVASANGPVAKTARTRKALAAEGIEVPSGRAGQARSHAYGEWRPQAAREGQRKTTMTTKVCDYDTGATLPGLPSPALIEASRGAGDTGAVVAYERDGVWEHIDSSRQADYRRMGHDVRTVYVED